MKRFALLLLFLVNPAWGQDIKLPATVTGTPGDFIQVPSDTKGEVVRWYAVDKGIKLFPIELLKDTHTAIVIGSTPGKYRLIAWTAIGNAPSKAAECLIIIEGSTPTPIPPGPGPSPPIVGGLYFLIVRPDGPASPTFTSTMSLPAWKKLRDAGHTVGSATHAEVVALKFSLPVGTRLPTVITLKVDGNTSVEVRGPTPLPTTDSSIEKLPEGL